MINKILSKKYINLKRFALENKEKYKNADPFPHIVIDQFFDEDFLNSILTNFPDLSLQKNVKKENRSEEIKYVTKGDINFSVDTKELMTSLNSELFLNFLKDLTNIDEMLISDPYYIGGGLHEIKKGGHLDIHADFNKHPYFDLDRRLNLIIYLNKNWEDEYGGYLELWNKDMSHAVQRIKPIFNRVVIFSTTSESFHGHPDTLQCNDDISRKSIALYYYSSGRPINEINIEHDTIFKVSNNDTNKYKKLIKNIIADLIPPIIFKIRDKFLK